MNLRCDPAERVRRAAGTRLRRWLVSGWLALSWAGGAQAAVSVVNSKHNLSALSPNAIKASTQSDVCIFCHTVHGASPQAPLWNRPNSGATYNPYGSSTARAVIGQPTGSSKLCLSCHDGTIALGMVLSRPTPIQMAGGVTTMPSGRSLLGTDLADDHPISFTYDSALASANGQLVNPAALNSQVHLDANQQLQCTTCHDPHNDQNGRFLVVNNTASALCTICHRMNNWESSDHRASQATWNGQGQNPWPHTPYPTVAANACEGCHAPHAAGTKPRLLNWAGEEQNCYPCHNGHVAAKDIQTQFNKPSYHPIDRTSGVHDPMEDPLNPTRHVECVDCHNPHAARAGAAAAPNAPPSLAGVKGVNLGGAVVAAVTKEYELCFRCHADSNNRGPARVTRQFVQTNTRLDFQPANASYHPVVAVGKNPNVPSLIAPWSTASMLYCTDCHNNDQGPKANGSGPNGPHGSAYTPLLERQLVLADYNNENSGLYALCYKCHSQAVVLGNTSWPYHRKHVVEKQTACTTCHDAHGSSKPGLINFNTFYVTASQSGRLEFSGGGGHGTCYLTCHRQDHSPKSY